MTNNRKMWFCYEFDFANRPVPVVYYDNLPTSSVAGKEAVRKRVQVVDVSATETNIDGEISISALQKLYPYISPQESIDKHIDTVIEETKEQNNMSRPVEGFLTKQGKFFEHEDEARLYEARYDLNKAATGAVVALGVSGEGNIESAVEALVAFINKHDQTIEEYLTAKRQFEAPKASDAPVELDGSSTPVDTSDDTFLRGETSVSVDDSTPAETNPAPTRKSAKS